MRGRYPRTNFWRKSSTLAKIIMILAGASLVVACVLGSIAFFYPVTTSALPSIGDVSAEEQQRVDSDPEAYLGEKAEMLNALAESDWDPSLSILDSVLAWLRFQTTASGE